MLNVGSQNISNDVIGFDSWLSCRPRTDLELAELKHSFFKYKTGIRGSKQ